MQGDLGAGHFHFCEESQSQGDFVDRKVVSKL